jgi:hypothetical protein
MILEKVISGGQTGADQAGLRAAKAFGIPTGGWMPLGFTTLAGPRPEFYDLYGMREFNCAGYAPRTWANVRDSDGTLRFACNFSSSGEMCTLKAINYHRKPYQNIRVPMTKHGLVDLSTEALDALEGQIRDIATWMQGIHVLNVAGNSDRTCCGIGAFVESYLTRLFNFLKNMP